MNGSIEGRCTNYKNFSVCNPDFIARGVVLGFFKVMGLPKGKNTEFDTYEVFS